MRMRRGYSKVTMKEIKQYSRWVIRSLWAAWHTGQRHVKRTFSANHIFIPTKEGVYAYSQNLTNLRHIYQKEFFPKSIVRRIRLTEIEIPPYEKRTVISIGELKLRAVKELGKLLR